MNLFKSSYQRRLDDLRANYAETIRRIWRGHTDWGTYWSVVEPYHHFERFVDETATEKALKEIETGFPQDVNLG